MSFYERNYEFKAIYTKDKLMGISYKYFVCCSCNGYSTNNSWSFWLLGQSHDIYVIFHLFIHGKSYFASVQNIT